MKQFLILYTFILFLQINFCGCDKQDSFSKNPITKMVFNIDSSQIGAANKDYSLQILYSAPVKWKEISGKELEAVRKGIESISSNSSVVRVNPVSFFADDSLRGILSVSQLQFSSKRSYSDELNEYSEILMHKFGSSDVKSASYLKDELSVSQFLIQTEDKIIFKILFPSGEKIVQFDYIADRSSYPLMIKSIESSIGSIHLLNKSSNNGKVLR